MKDGKTHTAIADSSSRAKSRNKQIEKKIKYEVSVASNLGLSLVKQALFLYSTTKEF